MADADKPEQDMVCNAPMAYTGVRMVLLGFWVGRVLRVGRQADGSVVIPELRNLRQ